MKRIISAFLAVILTVFAFSFAGCKNTDDPEESDAIRFTKLGDYIRPAFTIPSASTSGYIPNGRSPI